MKNVIIISTMEMANGNSAASSRMMNYAKALAFKKVNVYLMSYLDGHYSMDLERLMPCIYYIRHSENPKKERKSYFQFFKDLKKLIYDQKIQENCAILLYPSTRFEFDPLALIASKFYLRVKIYYEVNELRRYCPFNKPISSNFVSRIIKWIYIYLLYVAYYANEIFIRYYDGLTVISTNLENYFKKKNRNIIRIPILCDADQNRTEHHPGFKRSDGFNIGFAGSVRVKKEGFDVLYKALSILATRKVDFTLHLFGEIDKNEAEILLRKLPAKYGFENRIIYHGIFKREELPGYLNQMDLLIVPRGLSPQTFYGFSTKIAEYLSLGKPILVTNVSDNCLYLKDMENSFVVEPGNPSLMGEKFYQIIKNYPELHEKISANAYLTAQKCFHYSNYAELLSDFIRV